MSHAANVGVRIAQFKARLGRYLRGVRKGHPLTLLDRDTPVARVVPYGPSGDRLAIRGPLCSPAQVRLPPPAGKGIDSLSALLAEREAGRERLP